MNDMKLIPLHAIGDKVRIRRDLVLDSKEYFGLFSNGEKTEDGYFVLEKMLKYSGKKVTIVDIRKNLTVDCFYYKIKEDMCQFMWTDEMFENESCFFISLI